MKPNLVGPPEIARCALYSHHFKVPQDSSMELYMFCCNAWRLVSAHSQWPCTWLYASLLHGSPYFEFLARCLFFSTVCFSKHPNRNPNQTVRKHPKLRLERGEEYQIQLLLQWCSGILDTAMPLPLQHPILIWCQQDESTHHFLKSLTLFRRPTHLFCDFDIATAFHAEKDIGAREFTAWSPLNPSSGDMVLFLRDFKIDPPPLAA